MIPLYRGELHKVSSVPRQWIVPKSQIPLSVFKSALKKRNAALNRILQPSAYQSTDANGTPFANGTGEAPGLASGDGSDEHQERGGRESDEAQEQPENNVDKLDGKLAENRGQTELAEEESERREERKRKREEDSREDIGQHPNENDESVGRDLEASEGILKGNSKLLLEGPQAMVVDGIDQQVPIDSLVEAVESKVIQGDDAMAELVRVRVGELGGTTSEPDNENSNDLGVRIPADNQREGTGSPSRNVENAQVEGMDSTVSTIDETKSSQIQVSAVEETTVRDGVGVAEDRVADEMAKKKDELEAKLEKLRAEKHRFVLRLKQVLNEEEMKKRGSLASGSPASLQAAAGGSHHSTGPSIQGDKLGVGGSLTSADLEDGELEYARTPSPPSRVIPSIHGNLGSQTPQGLTPVVPAVGRQTSLSQHLSQSTSGRGGFYVPGLGLPPSPAAPGIAGGAQSPGTTYMGNLPSPLGSHKYSHNLALQHTGPSHAQKVTSVAHGHGQFSPNPSSGGPVGAVQGVSGGPPGFSGYGVSPPLHSHHSLLAQSSSSSLPHPPGQQGNTSTSLLTTPRGPPGYHEVRLGSNSWTQR